MYAREPYCCIYISTKTRFHPSNFLGLNHALHSQCLFLQRNVDQLFIVHTGKDDTWKIGGPLSADLDTALQNWPHHIVSLQGSVQNNIVAFLDRNHIDLVVLGEDFPRQGGFQIASVADWVKSNVGRPFIIIRQSAVRNERLRLSGDVEGGFPGRSISPELTTGRKVAIAWSSFTVGSRLIELAKTLVLLPQDDIYVVHCFPTERKMTKHTKSLLRTITLGLPVPGIAPSSSSEPRQEVEVTEENSEAFGSKELEGYNVNLNVALRGDPRSALASFCESEGIELLVISSRSASRLRKTVSGGSVSGYLIDKAPCPCMVLPLKTLGLEQVEEGFLSPRHSYEEPEIQSTNIFAQSPSHPVGELGTGSATTATVAALQAQVAERDKIIADLREQVAKLRLEAAEARDTQQHDPVSNPSTY